MSTKIKPPARILLAEDHALFRHGLATLLHDQPDLEVVGQAGDGLEAVQLARESNVDLVIMDINMPISDGLEATRLLHQILPEVKIMMLTINDQDKMLFEAIKAGAGGYMLKSANADDVLEGVRQMLAGQAVVPPHLAAQLLQEFGRMARQTPKPATPQQDFGLTNREIEVLQFIASGNTDKEIAQRLDLSVYTIKSHVRKILSKLHTANRWEAAQRAREEGLLNE
jgi:two-component system NarL family response regulator